MSTLEDLGTAITDALESNPTTEVLGVLCGSLVGLVREMARRGRFDPEKTIRLNAGPGQRMIEIHALQSAPVKGPAAKDAPEVVDVHQVITPSAQTDAQKLEPFRTEAHRALDEAERAWHTYASVCEVGDDRTRAFDVFENVRCARRV